MNMIEKNLFRPLPVLKKSGAAGEMGLEDEELLIDPGWPHLQVFNLFELGFFFFCSRFMNFFCN